MTITTHDTRTGQAGAVVAETDGATLTDALERSARAAAQVAAVSPAQRREWITAIADDLLAHRDELAELAESETALGMPRLTGEVERAAGQLRFYAGVAAEGSYLGVTLDGAASLARVNHPLGLVAVFGASNFPFAFGVLGNDTTAALSAGCPVVVKAHPAHPLLSNRLGEIAREALARAGAPEGTFELVVGFEAGTALVQAPQITAVAFTGSQQAGTALWRLANERESVIPVFAEMGTVNPVVVTPAGAEDAKGVAEGFIGSCTLGQGQFCTKPRSAPGTRGGRDARRGRVGADRCRPHPDHAHPRHRRGRADRDRADDAGGRHGPRRGPRPEQRLGRPGRRAHRTGERTDPRQPTARGVLRPGRAGVRVRRRGRAARCPVGAAALARRDRRLRRGR